MQFPQFLQRKEVVELVIKDTKILINQFTDELEIKDTLLLLSIYPSLLTLLLDNPRPKTISHVCTITYRRADNKDT